MCLFSLETKQRRGKYNAIARIYGDTVDDDLEVRSLGDAPEERTSILLKSERKNSRTGLYSILMHFE